MRKGFFQGFSSLICALVLAQGAAASGGGDHGHNGDDMHAVPTMAKIVVHLNHYPSDAEKKTLNSIVKSASASAHEKTIATALMNMEHAPTAADKAKLQQIVADHSAPEDVKTLAKIVMNINHKPSSEAKKSLQSMMSDHH